MLKNSRALMTGMTGQVGASLGRMFAPYKDIHGMARYGRPGLREEVAAMGITPVVCDTQFIGETASSQCFASSTPNLNSPSRRRE